MNKDNYKKALDQIHASDDLKNKTFEKISNRENIKNKSFNKDDNYFKSHKKVKILFKYAAICTVFVIVFTLGFVFLDKKVVIDEETPNKLVASEDIDDLPRFESMEQLKSVLKQVNYGSSSTTKGEISFTESLEDSAINSESVTQNTASQELQKESETVNEFSTTNKQVENVDEADIVKTDGKCIYYITNNTVYIIDAESLEILSTISNKGDKENFSVYEIFLKNDKLIVLGNYHSYQEHKYRDDMESQTSEDNATKELKDSVSVTPLSFAKAIVYDIKDKKNPKIDREVSLDGYYINSRMIGDTVYFISRKAAIYYENTDDGILPIIKDTATKEDSRTINYNDIVYFGGDKNCDYMLVGGFNINNDEEVNVETFFGASNNIYANEKNMYITQVEYGVGFSYNDCKTIIYKFNLEDSKIKLQCKGEVEGYLDSQFSMDEYDGNLRLATTVTKSKKLNDEDNENDLDSTGKTEETVSVTVTSTQETTTTNNLYILNENLEKIGMIENIAQDEKIYAVRFIGKIGYIVTFQQVDPLFVIDLSDPTNPAIKGELKIPGYSSYLHPYDETHIIGIGNNVKDNGYGGVTNTSMKMSMFDVSDLENPKEIFSVDIGNSYAYSEINYNHKSLFYNKSKGIIGFPVTLREYRSNYYKNGFVLYKINLENNEFEKYGEIFQNTDYRTNINRAIYINDKFYTLANYQIVLYDFNSFEKIKDLELE